MEAVEPKCFKELGLDWIGLELNNTCNIRCTFCPLSIDELQRPAKERLMPFELVEKIITEVSVDGSLDHIILNDYGEPFLYPRFKDVLKLCREKKIRIRFGTNGTQFTKDNINLIKEYEPDEMVISVQYFMRNNYKTVKGTKIDYDDWLNQIAIFLKSAIAEKLKTKIQLAIACNYNNSVKNSILGLRSGDQNLPYPDKLFFKSLNDFIKEFCEKRLGTPFDSEKIEKIGSKINYEEYYKINNNISFELKSFFDSTNFYNFKEIKKVKCFMPYVVINAQGKILLCCADYIAGTAIGNVQDKNIKGVLSENYDVFKNKNNEKAKFALCRKCAGERTYRGVFVKKIFNGLKEVLRPLVKKNG